MKPELENKPLPSDFLSPAPEKEKNWLEIAEVRMVLYVVPAGIIFAIIGYVLSRFTK